LISFFNVILFCGGISLAAWLAFGVLLFQKNTRQGLRPITEYFLYSLGFYVVSAVTDYLLHQLDRQIFPQNILWIVTLAVVVAAFILGSETSIVAAYYVRRLGRGGLSEADIPPFKFVMQLTYLTTVSLICAISGFLTSLTFVGKTFFLLNVGVAICGAYGYAKSWRNPTLASRKRLTYPLIATLLWIIISIIMNLAFGWPM